MATKQSPVDPLAAIELIANDPDFQGRIRGGIAKEMEYNTIAPQDDVAMAAFNARYRIASAPGWAAAWQYAIDGGIGKPGLDVGVITDAQISSQLVKVFPKPVEPVDPDFGVDHEEAQ